MQFNYLLAGMIIWAGIVGVFFVWSLISEKKKKNWLT